jgi:hypothetical protein
LETDTKIGSSLILVGAYVVYRIVIFYGWLGYVSPPLPLSTFFKKILETEKSNLLFMCTFISAGGDSEEARSRGTENCRGERPLLADTNRRSRATKN